MNTFKIEIGGKGYTLLFGYTCYKLFMTSCFKFKDTYLTPIVEIDDKTEGGELTVMGLANLFYSAHLNYCYDKHMDVALTYDDFAEWLDEKYKSDKGQEVIAAALEIWAQSKEVKKLKEDIEKKSSEMQENLLSQISES